MSGQKKILILAGANVHVKLVKAAKELGVYTIVTDYLDPDESPAKQISDEHWELDVKDVDGIVARCQQEHIDGIVTGWIDICQIPYSRICEKLNLPCYGTYSQFLNFTNKHAFKKICEHYGVDTILEYSKEKALKGQIEFPVFVKPVDSSGSKGQSICNNLEELLPAINNAESLSSSGDIIIEKYLADKNSFQITYFFIDGTPYILRTADGYKGIVEDKLDKVALCSISPSIYTGEYLQTTHHKVVDMLKGEGIKNGPVMLQGFYDNGVFRFYDPGLRFPGVDFDIIYHDIFGINVMKLMVEFAITGKMSQCKLLCNENMFLNGGTAAVLFPTISAGRISFLDGLDEITLLPCVQRLSQRHKKGDLVQWSYNVNQRLAEIDIYCDGKEKLKELIKHIYSLIHIRDEEGNDMLYKPFDVNRIQ